MKVNLDLQIIAPLPRQFRHTGFSFSSEAIALGTESEVPANFIRTVVEHKHIRDWRLEIETWDSCSTKWFVCYLQKEMFLLLYCFFVNRILLELQRINIVRNRIKKLTSLHHKTYEEYLGLLTVIEPHFYWEGITNTAISQTSLNIE